ncbi:MAG: helix-turn-helix transcriptional regulator [bacterium]|nr:helix-turn-helix transcriptional regulator [bacterium]
MQRLSGASDDAVLVELGSRIARYRLNQNLTQDMLASEAGVSKRTLQRIEHGHSAQATQWIRLLRALDLLENIESLIPEPVMSPIQQVKMLGKERRRASFPVKRPDEKKPWTWGDEE